jgi:hypothetical protein
MTPAYISLGDAIHLQDVARGVIAARPPPGLEEVVASAVPPPPLPPPGLELESAVRKPQAFCDSFSCCSTAYEEPAVYVPGRTLQIEAREKPVLNLEGAVEAGVSGLPSMGSAGHHMGLCKPCDFLHRSSEGCKAGQSCKFCHLCGADEMKRRKLLKKRMIGEVKKWQASAVPKGRLTGA